MERSSVRSVVNWLLLTSVVLAAVTGFVVDQLDLNEFRLHSWSGYAMAVLAAIHVGLVRRRSPRPERNARPPSTTPLKTVSGERRAPTRQRRGVSRRAAIMSLGATVGGAGIGWLIRGTVVPDPYDGSDVGLFYHQQSSLGVSGLIDAIVSWGERPDRYKRLGGEVVLLPPVEVGPTMSVAEAIGRRRSLREYADRPMTSQELSWLTFAATGITSGGGLRTAPSAGGLYPIETYVAVDRVEGIEPGLYHVDVRSQALERMTAGSVAGDLMLAGLGQGFLRDAPVVLVLASLFQRTRWKYHERHYRYVCWEAGHIAQNVYLAAEAAGLGACVVGAFLDTSLNNLLDIDGRGEAALGLIAVGPR